VGSVTAAGGAVLGYGTNMDILRLNGLGEMKL